MKLQEMPGLRHFASSLLSQVSLASAKARDDARRPSTSVARRVSFPWPLHSVALRVALGALFTLCYAPCGRYVLLCASYASFSFSHVLCALSHGHQ